MLFVNIVLGFASRVAPQLSIFSVGFPVTLLTGLAVLALGTGHLMGPMQEALTIFLAPLR
jgi:flagellar biosynthetic protein FliR